MKTMEEIDEVGRVKIEELKKLAKQDNADAQFFLGGMYCCGIGVRKNYLQAIKWYQLAANQGVYGAQVMLKILQNNDGVESD